MVDASSTLRPCPLGCRESGDAIGELATTSGLNFSRTRYTLGRCGCQGLLYLSPAPSAADLKMMYEDQGQFDGPEYTDEARVRAVLAYADDSLDRVGRHCGWASQPRRILEVGAGLAWMCRAAKARHPEAITVAQDVSPEAVGRCAWVDHYVQAEIADPQFTAYGPYDLISLTHVIEHLVDPVAVVRRCRELLAPEGLIFVTAPHRPRGWQDAAPNLETWARYSYNHVPAHIQYFSEISLQRLAVTSGCSLIYWSHDHEGGEAFEAWLVPKRSESIRARLARASGRLMAVFSGTPRSSS